VPAGLVAVQVVALAQLTPVAAVAPKLTVVGPPAGSIRLVPVMVTMVPPDGTPEVGAMPVTVMAVAGAGVTEVNTSDAVGGLVCPPTVVTVTSTGPAPANAGLVAVHVVSLVQLTAVALAGPNLTVGVPPMFRPVPLMVTTVPPEVGPVLGTIPVTAGTGAFNGTRQRWPWLLVIAASVAGGRRRRRGRRWGPAPYR
jgi:hypothetical protein